MNGYHPYTKVDCKLMWDEKKYNIFVKADNITCHRYYDLTAEIGRASCRERV